MQAMARKGRKRSWKGTTPGVTREKRERPPEDPRKVALLQQHRGGSQPKMARDRAGNYDPKGKQDEGETGSPLEWLHSPVGRLLVMPGYHASGLSKSGLYEAAMRYAAAYRDMLAARHAKRPWANTSAGGGMGVPDDKYDEHLRKWGDVDRDLRGAGEQAEKAVQYVVLDVQADDYRPPFWVQNACIHGLIAIAKHYGIEWDGDDLTARKLVAP